MKEAIHQREWENTDFKETKVISCRFKQKYKCVYKFWFSFIIIMFTLDPLQLLSQ